MDPETYQVFFEAVVQKSIARLHNTYRCVPITSNGAVIEIRGNEVKFEANSLQIICARLQKFSFILLNNLMLQSAFNYGEIKSETVTFKDPKKYHRPYGFRKYVRVEPALQNPINVQIASPRIKSDTNKITWLSARMLDISIHGMAIYLNGVMYKLAPTFVDDPINLKFTLIDPLTNASANILLDGEIKDVSSQDEKFVRIGIETKPDRNTENELTRYVAQLQKDIIQELKDTLNNELLSVEVNS